MFYIFFPIFLLFLIVFITGLINPAKVVKWGTSPSRADVLFFYGSLTLASLMFAGVSKTHEMFFPLMLISLILFVIGLIRPQAVIRWEGSKTRSMVFVYYGIFFLASSFLVGKFSPKSKNDESKKDQPAIAIQRPSQPSGMSPTEVAKPTEVKQSSVVAKQPVKAPEAPVKVEEKKPTAPPEKSFGLTVDQWKKDFNAKIGTVDEFRKYRITKVEGLDGKSKDVLKLIEVGSIGLLCILNDDETIREMDFILAGSTIRVNESSAFILLIIAASQVLNKDIQKDKHAKPILALLEEAGQNKDTGKTSEITFGKFKYSAMASSNLGLHFIIGKP